MKEQIKEFMDAQYKPVTIVSLITAIIISYFSIMSTNEMLSFLGGLIASWLIIVGIYGMVVWNKLR